MVMKLNTGVPGSGKSYLMVKSYVDLFCVWDKETERYVLQEKHKDKVLISNIEGLTLEHLDIEVMMSERCLQLARTKFVDNIGDHDIEKMNDVIDKYYDDFMMEKVRWFFTYDFQKSLLEKHGPIIYLIEECQRYFDSKELGRQKWSRDVLYFFEKHRHFGFSIFCDTQHHSKIVKGIAVLFETEMRAKPRTLSLLGEFKYNEYSDGSRINAIPIVVKPNQKIFKCYKSMSHNENVKTKKPALKILVFVIFMVFISVFVLNYAKNNLGPGDSVASEIPKVVKVSRNKNTVVPLTIEKEKIKGEWVRLAFTLTNSGKITVVHPLTNGILLLKEFDLETKRQGRELYAFLPGG